MQTRIQAQHLAAVQFGIFDTDTDEFLTSEDEIEKFFVTHDANLAGKLLAKSIVSYFDELKSALEKELADCYAAGKRK